MAESLGIETRHLVSYSRKAFSNSLLSLALVHYLTEQTSRSGAPRRRLRLTWQAR